MGNAQKGQNFQEAIEAYNNAIIIKPLREAFST